jgi:hypothetical protein
MLEEIYLQGGKVRYCNINLLLILGLKKNTF